METYENVHSRFCFPIRQFVQICIIRMHKKRRLPVRNDLPRLIYASKVFWPPGWIVRLDVKSISIANMDNGSIVSNVPPETGLSMGCGGGDSWSDLFCEINRIKNIRLLEDFLARRHGIYHDAGSFLYGAILDICQEQGHEAIRWLYGDHTAQSAFKGLFLYFNGLERAASFDLDATSRLLDDAAFYSAQAIEALFHVDRRYAGPIFSQILQQASLIEPSGYTSLNRLPEPDCSIPPPCDAWDRGAPIFVAVADPKYLEQYGRRFLTSLSEQLGPQPSHIHVVNPNRESEALLASLQQDFPTLAFSGAAGPARPEYYASARFLLAERLMRAYDRDLVLTDVDSFCKPGFRQLLECARRFAVAYIGGGNPLLPSLAIDACFLYFRNGAPVATRFLRDVADYLFCKLAEDMVPWTVDQAALFRARCFAGPDGNAVADLRTVLPTATDPLGFLKGDHTIDAEQRMRSRLEADTFEVTFDSDRRCRLVSKKGPSDGSS